MCWNTYQEGHLVKVIWEPCTKEKGKYRLTMCENDKKKVESLNPKIDRVDTFPSRPSGSQNSLFRSQRKDNDPWTEVNVCGRD